MADAPGVADAPGMADTAAVADAVVDLIDVTRSFQMGDTEVRALQGVSLTVRRGEFIAIMGSSGSGKSTLMNIIGCLDRPTSGQYLFEGRDVARLSENELADIRGQRIGFVFQSFNLLARTSALENVVLPLLYGAAATMTSKERNDRGREGLGGVGLADRERSTPSQLSGGQQQRVALARALINRPAVLLADEPTGNLDTRTSHEIMEIIRKLNREQGVTVILVTHEADIGAYADRHDRDARRQDRLRRAAACRRHADERGDRRRGRRFSLARQHPAARGRVRIGTGLSLDGGLRLLASARAQQAALGPDHARGVHRRGRADRDGRRRRRRKRGGEKADGESGHQHGGGAARARPPQAACAPERAALRL